MKYRILIRPIAAGETGKAEAFIKAAADSAQSRTTLRRMGQTGCVLGAHQGGRLVGLAGLDPGAQRMLGPWLAPKAPARVARHKLVTAIERLAVEFGLATLNAEDHDSLRHPLQEMGYTPADSSTLSRSIARRTTRFGRHIRTLNAELGIPAEYGAKHWLRLHPEATNLVSIGKDIYERTQRMTPSAASAWKQMVKAALADGVEVQPVSAFRSVEYQAGIVRRKLERGQSVDEILRVSAAPGYSEHHSGRAIDVTTPGAEVLEESFEETAAFEWLCANAANHGFSLSYPKKNLHGIAYEPWHWAWLPDTN